MFFSCEGDIFGEEGSESEGGWAGLYTRWPPLGFRYIPAFICGIIAMTLIVESYPLLAMRSSLAAVLVESGPR